MPISDGLLKEFDREMATTRKTLARIPENKLTWKPTIAESRAHVLGVFDKTTPKAREAIANTDDAKWGANWKLSSGDQVFYNGPRIVPMPCVVLNQINNHRA